MEVLLVDPLVPEALNWLQDRHEVVFQPDLGDDPAALRKAVYKTRAIVLPPHVVVSQSFLDFAPKLQVVARMQISSDNTDLDACAKRRVRVVQARSATVRSNAEYMLYGLLMLYRRGMVSALLGRPITHVRMGRELAGSTVGLLGLAPVAHALGTHAQGHGCAPGGLRPGRAPRGADLGQARGRAGSCGRIAVALRCRGACRWFTPRGSRAGSTSVCSTIASPASCGWA